MSKSQKILIADDHPLLLRGLSDFLNSLGYQNIVETTNGLDAYNIIIKEEPSLAILDIRMPKLSGLEVAKKCKTNRLKTKIIIITLHQEKELYERASSVGISGYIFKQFALKEIEECIEQVLAGEEYFSEQLKDILNVEEDKDDILAKLTPSEIKILRLIQKRMTTPQIAEALFVSGKTIEKHRSNMSKKLNLSGKTNSLLLWATNHKSILQ